jgi:hypothetical protein
MKLKLVTLGSVISASLLAGNVEMKGAEVYTGKASIKRDRVYRYQLRSELIQIKHSCFIEAKSKAMSK